ncbi:MAG TPA: hypothetical protein VGB74_05785 [Actinoplanes sp.]|jgi:uncharacterized membrane protein YiaA
MDMHERPGDAARTSGAFAVIIGLLITGIGVVSDSVPVRGYFFAGLLVVVGIALRVETAIRYRPAPVESNLE